mgnify:FL=1
MIDIMFKTALEAEEFVKICQSYRDDINLYYGHQQIDAKSILGVVSCGCNQKLKVEILTDKFRNKTDFVEQMQKFKA